MKGLHFYFNIVGIVRDSQERDLVKRCQRRDPKAMEKIVNDYQGFVYNIAYGMIGNAEDAKDITQDAFLTVWEKVGQFKFRSSFSTWLYRIVVNLCINKINNRERRQARLTGNVDTRTSVGTETPEKEILRKELQEKVEEALAQLKEEHRKLLILREMGGLSYEEIADVLKCPKKLVKSRLYEARTQLREILKQYESE